VLHILHLAWGANTSQPAFSDFLKSGAFHCVVQIMFFDSTELANVEAITQELYMYWMKVAIKAR